MEYARRYNLYTHPHMNIFASLLVYILVFDQVLAGQPRGRELGTNKVGTRFSLSLSLSFHSFLLSIDLLLTVCFFFLSPKPS